MRIVSILAAVAALTLTSVAAHAAGTKTVKDWTAVCDNLGDCKAFGFSGDGADLDSYLVVQRQGGGAAAPRLLIVLDAPDAQKDQIWTLSIDGKPIAGVGPVHAKGGETGARATLTDAAAASVIAALRNGGSLSLDQDGKSLVEVSLSGSSGALLWVDDQQGRVGTVTALTQKGSKPASAVPPRKPAPLISVATAAASQTGLAKHSPKGLTKDDADCDTTMDPETASEGDIIARLAPGVVLYGPVCDMAAYNQLNIFFVGDEHGGHLRKVAFPEAPALKPATGDFLMNAEFDPATQTMSAFAKGRGIGDCGSEGHWVWDGKSFQLLDEQVMPDCRGALSDDWPTVWVAHRK
jgi:hypothetical protein